MRVYGARLCGRCHDVKAKLEAAGIRFEYTEVDPRTTPTTGLGRFPDATLHAVLTWQDGTFPIIVGRDFESGVLEHRVEDLCEASGGCHVER